MVVKAKVPVYRTPPLHRRGGPTPRKDADAERAYRLFDSHLNDNQRRDLEMYGWIHILMDMDDEPQQGLITVGQSYRVDGGVHLVLNPASSSLAPARPRPPDTRVTDYYGPTVTRWPWDEAWARARERWMSGEVSDTGRWGDYLRAGHYGRPGDEEYDNQVYRLLSDPFHHLNGTKDWEGQGIMCIQFKERRVPFRFSPLHNGEAWAWDRSLVMLLQSQDPDSWMRNYYAWG